MSDIWDEKPESNLYPLKNEPSDHWYEKFNMDAWLEKVKAEYDEIREKAEKWDKWLESDAILTEAVDISEKLEAVRNGLPNLSGLRKAREDADYIIKCLDMVIEQVMNLGAE